MSACRILHNLHIGTYSDSLNQYLQLHKINTVINLTADTLKLQATIITRTVPNQGLMISEIPRMITRIDAIANIIRDQHAEGKNVYLYCEDGKNKSALIAAYYRIIVLRQQAQVVIDNIIYCYLSPDQIRDDKEYNIAVDNYVDNPEKELDPEMIRKNKLRRQLMCLTYANYTTLLKQIANYA
jgi:protein tyrosine/serine phosphatase